MKPLLRWKTIPVSSKFPHHVTTRHALKFVLMFMFIVAVLLFSLLFFNEWNGYKMKAVAYEIMAAKLK